MSFLGPVALFDIGKSQSLCILHVVIVLVSFLVGIYVVMRYGHEVVVHFALILVFVFFVVVPLVVIVDPVFGCSRLVILFLVLFLPLFRVLLECNQRHVSCQTSPLASLALLVTHLF